MNNNKNEESREKVRNDSLIHTRLCHAPLSRINEATRSKRLCQGDCDAKVVPRCEGCQFGKLRGESFHLSSSPPASAPPALIHTDVIGPFVPAARGHRFAVIFADDATKMKTLYTMSRKSHVKRCFA